MLSGEERGERRSYHNYFITHKISNFSHNSWRVQTKTCHFWYILLPKVLISVLVCFLSLLSRLHMTGTFGQSDITVCQDICSVLQNRNSICLRGFLLRKGVCPSLSLKLHSLMKWNQEILTSPTATSVLKQKIKKRKTNRGTKICLKDNNISIRNILTGILSIYLH